MASSNINLLEYTLSQLNTPKINASPVLGDNLPYEVEFKARNHADASYNNTVAVLDDVFLLHTCNILHTLGFEVFTFHNNDKIRLCSPMDIKLPIFLTHLKQSIFLQPEIELSQEESDVSIYCEHF
ncbi:MAG: hypothetical protein PSV35_04405, partial [bacterium]|nr:hypothetical protein [bacterium]